MAEIYKYVNNLSKLKKLLKEGDYKERAEAAACLEPVHKVGSLIQNFHYQGLRMRKRRSLLV